MKLQIEREADVTILGVAGEFTADTIARFTEAAESAFAEQRRDFIVDLSEVTMIDSLGLEALTSLQRQCEEQLGMVRLCGVDQTMRKILEITRLDSQLIIVETQEEALSGLAHA